MKEFKVIRIIDDKTIVINAGEVDGIEIGDKFKIYVEGVELVDLDTKESYGRLETTKDIVTVIDTMEKMCICKKRIKKQHGLLPNNTYETIDDDFLNVEISQIENGLSDDLKIKVGDKAKKINNQKKHN